MRLRVIFLTVLTLLLLSGAAMAAPVCTPVSVTLCVAADDVADVWINGTYIDTFNYVNWDETGVYPRCVTLSPSIMQASNIVAMKVRNLRCCEIWGSWSIETGCADGSHSCITSDEANLRLYRVEGSHTTPPPVDGSGNDWNDYVYTGTSGAGWQDAVKVTGTIYGKRIFDPCGGTRLEPLSWNANSAAETDDFQTIYLRQPFGLTPEPTLPPTNFTITKSVLATPTPGIDTNDRITYQLIICNTGQYTYDVVEFFDDLDNGFSFDGPYGGDCSGYGDGSVCLNGVSGGFTGKWTSGFPGASCVTINARAVDYWVDSSEWCQYRSNVAGVRYGSPDWPSSNTVTVQMTCPVSTNTPTLTFSPSNTWTPSNTYTQTFTRTPTLTYTFTNTYTHTFTITNTFTFTQTLTFTPSNTYTHTFTPSNTNTPGGATWTYTRTPTNTRTFTNTHTYTNTQTYTNTASHTFTETHTQTVTDTPSSTATQSHTPTQTETPILRFGLQKSINAHEFVIGDTVQYCITFTNEGIVVSDLHIWDTIPYELDFLFATGTYNTQTVSVNGYNHTMVYWTLPSVVPGDTGSVCIWARVARFPHASVDDGIKYVVNEDKLRALISGRPPGGTQGLVMNKNFCTGP